jgi:hypothetical protein
MAKSAPRDASPRRARPVDATPVASPLDRHSRDDVARRAYELFCARGCAHGSDLDDWLQAEREVRTRPGEESGRSDDD